MHILIMIYVHSYGYKLYMHLRIYKAIANVS